ncbi:MAG: hypothetical protein WCN98_12755 [Verrucomicrobiaceae bacterium]
MKTIVQIISERSDTYTGKRGVVKQQILSCLDTDPEHPFINTFDYTLSDEEAQKHTGKLQGKRVELAITNMEPSFGGRIRARGAIVKLLAA